MQDMAQDLLTERKVSSHGTSQQHLDTYTSVEELTSKESLAKLESQNTIAEETLVLVERGHAEVKRGQGAAAEQGHMPKLMQDSAMRVVRMLRYEQDLGWAGRLRKALEGLGAPKPTGTQGRGKKNIRRRVRPFRAWQAYAHKHMRRFLTKDDLATCRAAVADPEKRREYSELGKQLGALGPRKRASYDRRLRTLRERCKLQGKTWDLQAAKRQLLQEDKLGFERDKQRHARQHRAVRKQRREQEAEAQRALATAVASEVCQNPLNEDIEKSSQAHQNRCLGPSCMLMRVMFGCRMCGPQ
jgi:hypothetical protein